ncbi:hypothetical protein DL764_000139 [Monosporascus ibericus]|uniref:AA1-like domain-containing protein n=1 Tax=Monosporascus ibericus TaxID=155417 RepID=A0A4Q4TUY2_9PEZI|nr:hypothetical protein DL764_000139 [Monosporascus ibericus]
MMQRNIVTALLGLAAVKGAAADFEIYIRGTNLDNSPYQDFTSVGAQIHYHSPLTCEETRKVVTIEYAKCDDASKRGWVCDGCTDDPGKEWPRVQYWRVTRFEMYNGERTVDGVRGNPHPLFNRATGAVTLYKLDDHRNYYQIRDKYDEILGYCWRREHPQEMTCPFIDSVPFLTHLFSCKSDLRPHRDLDCYGPGGGC